MVTDSAPPSAVQFVKFPYAVLGHPHLSHGAQVTYALLLKYAWGDGRCFPAMATLARDLKVNRNRVHAYIEELVGQGFVVMQQRGKKMTNIYILAAVASDATETLHHPDSDATETLHHPPSDATETLHHSAKTASDATFSLLSDATKTLHPYKEDLDTKDLDISLILRVGSLWADYGVPTPTETQRKEMLTFVKKWDARCEATSCSIEEHLLEAKEWLDDPRRNKAKRTASVGFLRNWVTRYVEGREEARRKAAESVGVITLRPSERSSVLNNPEKPPLSPEHQEMERKRWERIRRQWADAEARQQANNPNFQRVESW